LPSQASLHEAALAAYDALRKRPACALVDVFGRSLGTAVSTYVAARRAVRKLVLVSPFDSITAVASERYPWAPIALLLADPFDAKALAPRIHTPLLAIAGTSDRTVTLRRSQSLLNAWGGPATLHTLAGAGHEDLLRPDAPWLAIRTFLDAISR
jgi:pimeloyl-ACP methyl ester carboxylesterase